MVLHCILKSYKEALSSVHFASIFKKQNYFYSGAKGLKDALLPEGRVWEESSPEILYSVFKRFIRPGDHTYFSLGSGIGTDCFVAAALGFKRIVGYELEPLLVDLSRKIKVSIDKKNHCNLPIRFVAGNLFDAPIQEADFVYLYHDDNFRFGEKFTEVFGRRWKPGARLLFNSVRYEEFSNGEYLDAHLILKKQVRVNPCRTYYLQLFEF
jgi:hypothetical protein